MRDAVSRFDDLVLESDDVRIAFDAKYWRLLQLADRRRDIEAVGEPRLAKNLRLQLALPILRGHAIYGRGQRLDSVRGGERSLRLRWSG